MPFYEYQCKNCGRELEAMQKITEPPLKKCPHCGKSQLQRLMSAPVFRLKGGGWYETDFKDDKDKKRNLADRPEADAKKDSEAKGEANADVKSKAGADATPSDSKGPDKAVNKAGDASSAQKPAKKEQPKKAVRGRRKSTRTRIRKARR